MSDYPMLISNKLHSFRNFTAQKYEKRTGIDIVTPKFSSSRLFQALKPIVSHRGTNANALNYP